MLLFDAGVWIAAVDPEDRYHHCSRRLVLTYTPAAALDLTLYEVANVLGARKQRHDLAERICRSILARCGEHIVRIDAECTADIVAAIAEHQLTAYDAAYVAAARRRSWTLISTDTRDLVGRGLAVAPDDAAIPHSE